MLLIPLNLFAQTKKVVTEDLQAGLKEQYYVLKSNNEVLQGEYKAYNLFSNAINTEGFYKNNYKDSVWKYYGPQAAVILQGVYKEDKKIGVWNGYTRGQLQVSYDHTNKKLLYFKAPLTDSIRVYHVLQGADTLITQLQRPPVYLEGIARFSREMGRNVRYPLAAFSAREMGTFVVTFTINTDGKVSDFKCTTPSRNGLDRAAIMAVASIGGDWLPGMLNGQPVAVRYEVPVTYQLAPDKIIDRMQLPAALRN